MATEEKVNNYFIARYSLIPDSQIDLESALGKTKETKFIEWISSFETEKRKETTERGHGYTIYCKKLSDSRYLMSFAKETDLTIGQKTDDGIVDTPIKNHKKCNIFIDTTNQTFIIQKNTAVAQKPSELANLISRVLTKLLESKYLYMEIDLITEKNDFWKFVSTNKDEITDIEIKLASPNLLKGIKSVSDFLKQTNENYNNTSITLKLTNNEGRLKIDPNNPFLQDAVRYSSAGCGNWKIKSKSSKQWYANADNPFLVTLPDEVEQLKDSDLHDIKRVFEQVKRIDPELKEG